MHIFTAQIAVYSGIFHAEMPQNSLRFRTREKHKACHKKYKPYIFKYKAHILKYVPCIFCRLRTSDTQQLTNTSKKALPALLRATPRPSCGMPYKMNKV